MREPVPPVLAAELFPEVRAELLAVLSALRDDQWELPTACEGWSVRDVALHLLGDDIGLLSSLRDHDGQHLDVREWSDLVAIVNMQNHVWVRAARRLSRRLLLDLLAFTGPQVDALMAALDPDVLSGPVGWAGPGPDPQWLHIARELTEYWMHHQHICDAVGVTSLKAARYIQPVLSAFAHALPQAYRHTDAPPDTLVTLMISGEGGGEWHVVREAEGWALYAATDLAPASSVIMGVETAWRLFTRGLEKQAARPYVIISGDISLGEIVLDATAVIA